MPYDGTAVAEHLARTHATSLLTEREKHLIGLGVTLTRGCIVCTRNRIAKAREAGLGDETLNALTALVASVNAGVTAATARQAMADLGAERAAASECDGACSPARS